MTLIKSISGIRGTIGGKPGNGLNPLDIVRFVSAYSTWLKKRTGKKNIRVVVGRDSRISGEMVNQVLTGTLLGAGIDVLDLSMASTPTVEIAIIEENADGGFVITASHNPMNWNALKMLNEKGEFVSERDGCEILSIAEKENFEYASPEKLGRLESDHSYGVKHIRKILQLPLVCKETIAKANFKIVIDCVNSVGGIVIPQLLRSLGVKNIVELNCKPDGLFTHDPEPLPENLGEISGRVTIEGADLGLVVDPDVDRLAILCEDGSMFGEEYTLVAVADYVIRNRPGSTVSNLSSTQALRDVTEKRGLNYYASAVGEVNVVEMMKKKNAVIGGEGNGGVILPELHYGRDALVGIALFLTHLSKSGKTCSELRKSYPDYFISKNKVRLSPETDMDHVLDQVKKMFGEAPVNETDGIRIDLDNEWVLLRRSNTEPIIRIFAESRTQAGADTLAKKIQARIEPLLISD